MNWANVGHQPAAVVLVLLGFMASCVTDPKSISGSQYGNTNLNQQEVTFYPPAVHMQVFTACPDSKPCSKMESFRVSPIPKGCCVLLVTNGDGQETDEVRSYEVLLNGQQVIPPGRLRNAQAAVKLVPQENALKVTLAGGPHSKVFILIAYDPR